MKGIKGLAADIRDGEDYSPFGGCFGLVAKVAVAVGLLIAALVVAT